MKINVDLNEVVPGRGKSYFQSRQSASSSVTPTAYLNTSEGGSVNPLAANAGNERQLSQAMSIAINANALISKALVAAARLRSMAQETITRGNVDYREISENLAGIRTSLNDAGVAYSAPSLGVFPASTGAKLPPISDELASFNRAADSLKTAGPEVVRSIDTAIASLQGKQAAVEGIVANIGTSVDRVMSNYQGFTGGSNYDSMMKSVTADIARSPERALTAQGNINPEKVAGLFS